MTSDTARRSPFRSLEQREADRAAKREAVLLAAVDMFNARGFSATSLDDVAASLGVTKPVIYHYLGTKDRVLIECLKRGLATLRRAAEAHAGDGTGAARLRAFLIAYATINMTPFGRCVVLTADHELTGDARPRFRATKRRIDLALRGMIEAGIADHSLADGDARLIGFALAGALNWIPRWHDPAGPHPSATIAERMVDTLIGGIANSSSSSPRP